MKPILALLWLLSLLGPSPALAREARLSDIIVTNSQNQLLLYLRTEGAFTRKMVKAIRSGVPTRFAFHVRLKKQRAFWPDKSIAEMAFHHTIKYNNLRNEYRVKRSWEKESRTVRSLARARKLMTEITGARVISLDKLEKNREYQVQVKAELAELTLPLNLHYVLFFVSLWDFETDWYHLDFVY